MPVNFLLRLNQKTSTQFIHFTHAAWQRLCFGPINNNLIVARATPTSNKLTRWVIIYQNRTTDIRDEYFKLRYTIQDFEIPVKPHTEMVSIQDRINKRTWYVRKEEEIYEVLKRINISPHDFISSELCNYPFS